MITYLQNLKLKKYCGGLDGGVRVFHSASIIGQRSVIVDHDKLEVFYTKGKKYQIKATLPKLVYSLGKVNETVICFPGFTYSNWYHLVADIGFQVFLAKKKSLIDAIVLPKAIQGLGKPYQDFLRMFGLTIYYVDHPWRAFRAKEVVCFDRYHGRLTMAIHGGKMDVEVREYFHFLNEKTLNSNQYINAKNLHKKVFSTRSGKDSRVYDEYSEVEKEYEGKGYKIMHFGSMSLYEQMAIMVNVTHFAGFHGANLTNLIFSKKCKFMEEVVTEELSDDFQTIANFKNINHVKKNLFVSSNSK